MIILHENKYNDNNYHLWQGIILNKITIALAGQPNVGKTSLINAISNASLKVGNFSGVTVDKTEVEFQICDEVRCKDYKLHIIDLPGAYSLTEYTIEEKVTKSFLQSDEYDVIVNVVDSTNLQRNLLFTTQLLETGKKVVVVLNMDDEAQKEGIKIDEQQLSAILGVPCIKTSASNKVGIDALKSAIIEVYEKEATSGKVVYSDPIEEEINKIVSFLYEKNYRSDIPYRQLAVRLLQENVDVYKKMHDEPIWIEMLPIIRDGLNHIYLHHTTKDLGEIFADEHFAFAKGAKMEVMEVKTMKAKVYYTKTLQLGDDKDAAYNLALIVMLESKSASLGIAHPKSQGANASKSESQGEKKKESREEDTPSSGSGAGQSNASKKQKDKAKILSNNDAQKQPLGSKLYELINKGYIRETQPW
jgi:small GTP-binding protein